MITLNANSSSGKPYDVVFSFDNGKLSVTCTCKAGTMNTLCKHRIAFLRGDATMLFDPTQADQLATIITWVEKTEIQTLLSELNQAEDLVLSAQKRVKQLRKVIDNAISD